ncbi:hypothetical protein [Geobacter pickeringii]|uniref:hypothetical protein n=1 Tax=Geobacter pickeringii TaxID=345632 RepID=UPI000A034BB2|nr:hypothetical protein [Geobacter pickeringii]
MKKDHLEIILEDIRGKFDLVLEGHESLRQEIRDTRETLEAKIEHLNFVTDILANGQKELRAEVAGIREEIGEIRGELADVRKELRGTREELNGKIDAVAADLAAHRADTEAHHGVYRVKEG